MSTNRPLRKITRADLDSTYSQIDTLYGAYECACQKNPAYCDIHWFFFEDPGYQLLTKSQQTLNNLITFDGQVKHGGLRSFFYNLAYGMDHFASSVRDFGWPPLSDRFYPKFEEVFQISAGDYLPPVAAERIHDLYYEFDFDDFDRWWCSNETQVQAGRYAASFVKLRQTDLFEIVS